MFCCFYFCEHHVGTSSLKIDIETFNNNKSRHTPIKSTNYVDLFIITLKQSNLKDHLNYTTIISYHCSTIKVIPKVYHNESYPEICTTFKGYPKVCTTLKW